MSVRSLITSIQSLTDEDLREFFTNEELQKDLQHSMTAFPGGNVYEWLLKNRLQLSFWAFIHRIINIRMSVKVTLNTGHDVFISPTPDQLIKDGVTFLQGKRKMEGAFFGYKEGKVFIAVFKRDVPAGTKFLTSDDFLFIELDNDGKLPGMKEISFSFKEADTLLRQCINSSPNDEAAFQLFFQKYPWIFGLEYSDIQSHQPLDDSNIPDFSGVKARNGLRDIIEIKPCGLRLFGKNNEPLNAFHAAISQCERYIDFADRNKDYLMNEKGLNFDAPIAILVAGYNLDNTVVKEIRRKERLNPRIRIYTYNDILATIKSMTNVISKLYKDDF